MVNDKILDAVEGFGDFVGRGRVRTADVSFAAGAEGAAGDEGDVFRFEELFGKVIGRIAR